MANVPHDMYPAYLDKGERVLTASENRAYSGGSAVNVTNTFNVYGNPSDAQKREWIQDVEDAQRRAIRIAGLGGGFAYEGAFVNSGV
jgi:hypothetical protein